MGETRDTNSGDLASALTELGVDPAAVSSSRPTSPQADAPGPNWWLVGGVADEAAVQASAEAVGHPLRSFTDFVTELA